jgi:D-alanyl-lipoteichoic acid acyltransferase DltB (MBOAT superfamily)
VFVYNAAKFVSKSIALRNIIVLAGNLFILLTLVKEHTLIVIAILSLLVFLIGKVLQNKNSRTLLFTSLAIIIVLFSIRNYSYIQECLTKGVFSFLNAPILSVQKLGLSYILFRFVHYLIESYKNKIHKSNFITFLNYIFFFPSIIAGPIDTYNNFSFWIGNSKLKYHRSLFFAGVTRIFIGSVKTIGIVPFIIHYATDYTILTANFSPPLAIFISLLAYSAYIYLDFSGYSDIAIGSAYLIGIKTPENFNNPYISQNLSEFWKRWHITFSMFLKLYVFKPSILLYNKLINPKHRLLVTVLCYLTTFVICGIWHGDKINFLYWGLWHGVGLAANKIWSVKIKPRIPFSNTRAYLFISVFTTFIYVTIGWVFFNYSEEQLITLYNLIK